MTGLIVSGWLLLLAFCAIQWHDKGVREERKAREAQERAKQEE